MNPNNPFDSITTAQDLAVIIRPICEQIYRQIGPDRHESEYQEHLCHYLSRLCSGVDRDWVLSRGITRYLPPL